MNKELRVKALEEYEVLDTLPEKEFDDIVEMAAALCGVPISLITLLDSDRQWFKAKVGIDKTETPIQTAFCRFAIKDPQKVMVVNDALLDERFQNNPLVTGEPNIRFYAGAPLVDSAGHALGSLCVIDNRPRSFTEEQSRILKILANKVVKQLELRKENLNAKRQIEVSDKNLDLTLSRLLEAQHIAHIGSWEWDIQTNQIYNSPEIYNLFGLSNTGPPITMEIWEKLVHPEDIGGAKGVIEKAIKTNTLEPNEFRLTKANGETVWLLGMGTVLTNDSGQAIILKGTLLDITKQKNADQNREQYIIVLEEMLFALSHKVRRPVATSLGLIDVFNSEKLTEEKMKQYVGYFKTATDELDVYVKELTNFLQDKKTNMNVSVTK